MVFFLQDADSWPLTINHTMAMLTAYVRTNGVSLTADGNPAISNDGSGLTTMTLHYSAPGVTNTTVTVGSNYQIFCGGGSSGTCPPTGKWVANGTQFFLHNTPNGSTPTAANVIASFTATVIDLTAPGFVVDVQPSTMRVGIPYFPTVEVDAENGFSSAVTLGATGVPAGVSVSFAPQTTLVPSAQTGLEVIAPLTTPWSYMTITGTSGSVQHTDDFEIRNQPPRITGHTTSTYSGGTAMITVNATDAESDLSYVQINITGNDGQGTCAALVSLAAGPSVLTGENANGACSVVSTAAATGNGSSGTFQITFLFDSSRFYGPKNVTAFAVEQSTINTSSPIGGINIPQNQ